MELRLEQIKERLDLYEKLMRLDKPIGILLLLWPTLWALWLSALGRPDRIVLWVFILGTVLMRSAGCVINDYADRDFDKHVERTRERPLTAGKVTTREALALFAGLSLAAFAPELLVAFLDHLVPFAGLHDPRPVHHCLRAAVRRTIAVARMADSLLSRVPYGINTLFGDLITAAMHLDATAATTDSSSSVALDKGVR